MAEGDHVLEYDTLLWNSVPHNAIPQAYCDQMKLHAVSASHITDDTG